MTFRLLLAGALGAAPAVGALDSLRVYAIQPNVFPYRFTAVVNARGDAPVLSFNHLNGRTAFVRVGGMLGDHLVREYEPRTERFFNETINAYQERDVGVATLEAPGGERIELVRGRSLPREGRMACLVSLESGAWEHLQTGESPSLVDTGMRVSSVGEHSVTLAGEGGERSVPVISDTERDALVERWRERQRQAAERRARLAQERARARQEAAWQRSWQARGGAGAVRPRSASFAFGTEYRFPVEYEVLGWAVRNAEGKLVPRAIVVPKRFETRWDGVTYGRPPGTVTYQTGPPPGYVPSPFYTGPIGTRTTIRK